MHNGQRHERANNAKGATELLSATGLEYDAISKGEAQLISIQLAAASTGWVCAMTSHDLISAFENGFGSAGRYVFAPVPIVRPSSNVRLAGDGPSNWTVYMVVARVKERRRWGTLPGAYLQPQEDPRQPKKIRGTKPLALMEMIVRDYSEPGEVICDPYAGTATTGVAAVRLGRHFIGWERDPGTFDYALKRLKKTRAQGDLFSPVLAKPRQERLDV